MGLFDRKKTELPPLISDEELFPAVNYESVMEWLIGLSPEEYTQVTQVAAIHRQAYYEAAKVLNKPLEPTTQIDDPRDTLQTLPAMHIDKDPDFLTDDEPKQPKQKRIKVKD